MQRGPNSCEAPCFLRLLAASAPPHGDHGSPKWIGSFCFSSWRFCTSRVYLWTLPHCSCFYDILSHLSHDDLSHDGQGPQVTHFSLSPSSNKINQWHRHTRITSQMENKYQVPSSTLLCSRSRTMGFLMIHVGEFRSGQGGVRGNS